MNLRLLLLHLRRAASPWLALGLAGLALLLVGASSADAALGLDASDPAQAARGLLRGTAWALLAGLVVAVIAAGAAGEHARWRGGEALWSSTRRLSPWGVALAAWAGRAAALALWLLGVGLAIELAAGGAAPSFALGDEVAATRVERLVRDEPTRIALPLGPSAPGERARVRWRWRGDYGPLEALEVTLERGAQRGATAVVRPDLAQRLELELPAGAEPATLELRAVGATAPLALEGLRAARLAPAAERAGPWRVGVALWLFGAALAALAAGLGAWVSAPTALGLLLAAWVAAWTWGASALLPGAALAREFAALADARVPAPSSAATWAAAAALVLAGLALRVAGLRRGVGA